MANIKSPGLSLFNLKVDEILASLGPLENRAVKETVRFLRDAHREVMLELATSPEGTWSTYHLEKLERNINRAMNEYAEKLGVNLKRNQRFFWDTGVKLIEAPLGTIGMITMDLGAINLPALEAIQAHSTTFIRKLAQETAAAIRSELSWVMIGKKTPLDAIQAIGRSLDDPGIFQTTFKQAENIIRNEVNYAFSVAEDEAMTEAAKWVDELEKEWRYDHSPKYPRQWHKVIHKQRRKVKEFYNVPIIVGGQIIKREKLLYPRDRVNGSARNTIGCGCHSRPVLALAA